MSDVAPRQTNVPDCLGRMCHAERWNGFHHHDVDHMVRNRNLKGNGFGEQCRKPRPPLSSCEPANQRGAPVAGFEMRPERETAVERHVTEGCAFSYYSYVSGAI